MSSLVILHPEPSDEHMPSPARLEHVIPQLDRDDLQRIWRSTQGRITDIRSRYERGELTEQDAVQLSAALRTILILIGTELGQRQGRCDAEASR